MRKTRAHFKILFQFIFHVFVLFYFNNVLIFFLKIILIKSFINQKPFHIFSDASDEQNCLNANVLECPEGEFRCGGSMINYGAAPGSRCILNRFRCDGEQDCNGMLKRGKTRLNLDNFFLFY